MFSTIITMDEQQTYALEQMRAEFGKEHGFGMPMNDATFLRYLRARNFDVDKAKTMLHETLHWRRDFGVENMGEWKDVIAIENSPGKMYVRGYDKEGHALIYMKPRLENTNDHDGNIKHLVYTLEKAVACMANNTNAEKLCLLIDYEGYSLRNAPPMKTSMETLTILQNHYPERLFRAYMIRPPWIFHAFFNMISPFIDPVTKNKIAMVNSSSIKEKLTETIDPVVLEEELGGCDARPFVSSEYLQAPLESDFWTLLEVQRVQTSEESSIAPETACA